MLLLLSRFFGSFIGKAGLVLVLLGVFGGIVYQIKTAISNHAALVSERDQLKRDLATATREAEIANINHASELASARINTETASSINAFRSDTNNALTATIRRINDAARSVESSTPNGCSYPLHPSLSIVLERLLEPPSPSTSGGYRQGEAGPSGP